MGASSDVTNKSDVMRDKYVSAFPIRPDYS
jgi:hypothetical protein